MRILHIDTEKTWRGGQNQTRLLMEGLLNQSFEVYLAAPADSALAHAMRDRIPLLTLENSRGFDLSTAKQIAQYCRDEVIDVMDAQTAKAHSLAYLARGRAKDTKLVVHRRVDYRPSHQPFNWLKYYSRRVDAYIAISHAIGGVLAGYGVARRKIHVVHSAASPLEFRFRTKAEAKAHFADLENLNADHIWIGNASALSEQKDYPTFLRALAQLKSDGVRFTGLIAGSGKLEKKLKSLAQQLGLGAGDLRFLGFRDDIPDLLQALDILCVSSRDEGLGTIILDGLQAACCVVATNVGGIPEMIEHGTTGLLAPRADPLALAEQLRTAAHSESLRGLLASAGRMKVEKEFSIGAMIDGNVAVYQQLVGND